jgi:hypothetical protein
MVMEKCYNVRMKKVPGIKNKPGSPRRRYGLSAGTMWVVLIVWVILFLMIRSSTHMGGNPIIMFLIMFGLFFFLLFVIRLGSVRTQTWWRRVRPGLVRFFAGILPSRRR